MNVVGFILFGLFAAAQVWPKLGRSVADLLEWAAREQRAHSDALDRAYRAYAGESREPETPGVTGLDRHWAETAELEEMWQG